MRNECEIRGEMTVIFLRKLDGSVIESLIETADLSKLVNLDIRWSLSLTGKKDGKKVCGLTLKRNGTPQSVILHRFLMDAPTGMVVDHINGDQLDNRRSNLRIVTQAQNNQNRQHLSRKNKSGYIGVQWDGQHEKWKVELKVNGAKKYFGRYVDVHEAGKAAMDARARHMPYSKEARGLSETS